MVEENLFHLVEHARPVSVVYPGGLSGILIFSARIERKNLVLAFIGTKGSRFVWACGQGFTHAHAYGSKYKEFGQWFYQMTPK